MLKNEIINLDGTNWLVREATSRAAADSAITMARVTGSVGSKHREEGAGGIVTASADVVRLHPDGRECLPYGEKGTDYSALVELVETRAALAESRAYADQLGRALNQSNLRNRAYAGALADVTALGDCLPGATAENHVEFLRSEIARVVAEAHATIAEARKAAQAGSAREVPDVVYRLVPLVEALESKDRAARLDNMDAPGIVREAIATLRGTGSAA